MKAMIEPPSSAQSVPPPNTIDEHLVRLISGIVGLIAIVTLLTPYRWLLGLLAADFLILAFLPVRFSPLASVSSALLKILRMTPKPVYFPPKQFAAQVGAVVAGLACGLWLLGLQLASTVATLFLVVGAAFDSLVNYCLACWVYSLLQLLRPEGK
jgi:hypothetical protein